MKYFLIMCLCIATSYLLSSTFIAKEKKIEIKKQIIVDE